MKAVFNTTAFVAIVLAIIFSVALVLPQATTSQEAISERPVTSNVEELSSKDALGAIILVRQIRVTKNDEEKETSQIAYVDHVLARYE